MIFETGSTAGLKSGGPVMTVENVDIDIVQVVWFDNKNKLERATFPALTLEPKNPDDYNLPF
jgi:uncharacterized protein YodC (DUF2158 family)